MFITLEGIEGVGKTTHATFAAEHLRGRGRHVVETREPGGTRLGEGIRALLLHHDHRGMSSNAELLLMFAARAEHVEKVIRPALAAGHDVLSDRFTDASFAYQGGGRGVAVAPIRALQSFIHSELQPDLTVLLDAPVELALSRAGKRGGADRFESEESAFFERVRAAYLRRAEEEPDRIHVIDASQPLERVQHRIAAVLDRALS